MIFDKKGRWHDERGRFAKAPKGSNDPPSPEGGPPAPPRYEVTWTFSVRGFREPRVSPPREDTATQGEHPYAKISISRKGYSNTRCTLNTIRLGLLTLLRMRFLRLF